LRLDPDLTTLVELPLRGEPGVRLLLEYSCPLDTPHLEAVADVDGDDMRCLVKAMANGSLSNSVSFEELVQIAEMNGLFERFTTGLKTEKGKPASLSSFGKLLRSYHGRLVGDHRFLIVGRGRGRKYLADKPHPEPKPA
jgi:hypothetical protein